MNWVKLGRRAAGLAYLGPIIYILLEHVFGLNKLAGATFEMSLSYSGIGEWFTVLGGVVLITSFIAAVALISGPDERFKKFICAEAAIVTLYVTFIGVMISKDLAVQALTSSLIFRFLVLLSYFFEGHETKRALQT